MKHKRSLTVGSTDFTGVDLDEIIEHLKQWDKDTIETIDRLNEYKRTVFAEKELLDAPDNICSYINWFLDMFDRYSGEFKRLIAELPIGVEQRHCEALVQLAEKAKEADRLCVNFQREHFERKLKDERLQRPLIDRIYGDSRDQVLDYLDLDNLSYRLKALIGARLSPSTVTKDDISAFELKPNVFGIGINLNYIIKRCFDFFKGKKTGP